MQIVAAMVPIFEVNLTKSAFTVRLNGVKTHSRQIFWDIFPSTRRKLRSSFYREHQPLQGVLVNDYENVSACVGQNSKSVAVGGRICFGVVLIELPGNSQGLFWKKSRIWSIWALFRLNASNSSSSLN